MSVKALSSLVRKLVRNLVMFLVNNARKGACGYRRARYCTATIVASSVFGWQLHRRQLIRGHPFTEQVFPASLLISQSKAGNLRCSLGTSDTYSLAAFAEQLVRRVVYHRREPGCVNPVRARTRNAVRRAPHRQSRFHRDSSREPGRHPDGIGSSLFVPSCLSHPTRTFAKPQVRLPGSIRVHLWRKKP